MAPEIRDQLRRAAREPGGDLDPAALQRRVRQLRRRRVGSTVAAAALLVLLVPLGQAGLERLRQRVKRRHRPAPGPGGRRRCQHDRRQDRAQHQQDA